MCIRFSELKDEMSLFQRNQITLLWVVKVNLLLHQINSSNAENN